MCDSLIVEETDSGFRYEMNIPSAYFKFIIGKKAETKRRLENETATQIRIPKQGQDGPIGKVVRYGAVPFNPAFNPPEKFLSELYQTLSVLSSR